MSLRAGTRLGHYEVVAPIGAGGMGEVYKARDTRLNRQVAVKILPEHVSHDSERKQRFEREAQTIASLDHPNICVLYDVGHEGGIDFLVMEYLEGQTLADRIQKGPLPLDEALEYASQTAVALEKAHRKGVIHRDIKPANIMITATGVKVLDFGLAKLRATDSSGNEIHSGIPTQHSVTVSGSILGTIQYMAPEQIEGEEITPRTDIFAFGAVLYEMITGRKAFKGKSQASLMASILEHQPLSIAEVQPTLPKALDHLIRTCMAKEPDQRWQTCADLGIQLRWIAEHTEDKPEARRKTRARNRLMVSAIGLLAVGIAITSGLLILGPKPSAPQPVRFEVPLSSGSPNQIAVSPDGHTLAAITGNGGGTSLWLRRLDQTEPQLLQNTNGVSFPFWSPDGRSIGFFAEGKLKRIDATGGPPQTLCDAPNGRGGAWNRDGVILFSPTANGPLFRVSAAGGPAMPASELDKSRHETAHLYPQFLPDGKHFIFLANAQKFEDRAIYAGSLNGKETKRIVSAGFKGMFAEPGYLLFVRDNSLMAQRFNAATLELAGDPFPITDKIGRYEGNLVAGFSVSDTGTLMYRLGDASTRQISFIDRSGGRTQPVKPPGFYWDSVLSPDGKRIAFEERSNSGPEDLWVLDLMRDTTSRLTFDPAVDAWPVWSPDGYQIVFASNRNGGVMNLYQKSSSGGGEEKLLLKTDRDKTPEAWSMDGKYIVYDEIDSVTLNDVWVLPLMGDQKPIPVIKTSVDEFGGQLSPDSKWIAYAALDTGRPEVYVQDFPPSGAKYQISNMGAQQPRWSRNGKELFFLAGSATGDLMSVDVEVGLSPDKKPVLNVGLPKKIVSFNVLQDRNNFDIPPDGQRFLINTTVEQALSPLNVILNWTNAIKH